MNSKAWCKNTLLNSLAITLDYESGKPISQDRVEISIKDTGIGLSKEITDHLFQLDSQPTRKGTEKEPSTGLGLIVCKEFIEKNGGKLLIKSEEGKGSTFYFTLPSQSEQSLKPLKTTSDFTSGIFILSRLPPTEPHTKNIVMSVQLYGCVFYWSHQFLERVLKHISEFK